MCAPSVVKTRHIPAPLIQRANKQGDTLMIEVIEESDWDWRCLVCQRSVVGEDVYCHLRVANRMIALCCPLCYDTFHANPKKYLGLRDFRMADERARRPKEE